MHRNWRGNFEKIRGIEVLGPTFAPMSILVGRWRMQVVLRGSNPLQFETGSKRIRPVIRTASRGGVKVTIDVDPRTSHVNTILAIFQILHHYKNFCKISSIK